ncbi:hypothetical protein MSG28_005646 [Choristoneura fumiferana]|uniref:Uncharacterized protein n=1 Tax=Choristoneura fumiferana TaxID=7141 RepID=A0ACC0L0T1_CHOFU|nr:hypothetical protein MSG28_005646 [Choristoneura fumiferana]
MKLKSELLEHPTGEMARKIRIELKEDLDTCDRDVALIRDWLKKQPHLPDDWGIHPNLDSQQITDTLKLALMIGDVRLTEEKVGVGGDIYVLDAAVLGPSLLAKLSPSAIKKFMICVQEAFPVKLKEVHIINTSPIVERFVNFIHVHKDVKELYKYVPREMLPVEYGGDCSSMDVLQEQWRQKLEEYGDWFKAQESVKANEALRPGRPTNYDDLFGIDGSFRQLAID